MGVVKDSAQGHTASEELSQDSHTGDLASAATGRSKSRASISGVLLEDRDHVLLLSVSQGPNFLEDWGGFE